MRRFFFFSSRRRHTRLQGDWSSDVCSSDLVGSAWRNPVRGPSYRDVDLALMRRIPLDRKSTRLNSSHLVISYAVFCLKKKKIMCTSHSPGDKYTSRLKRLQAHCVLPSGVSA